MVKLTVKRLHKMLSCKPYMYWGVKQTTECLNFFLVEYKRHVIYVSAVVQLNINYRIESVNIVILLYQKQDSNMYIIFVYYQFLLFIKCNTFHKRGMVQIKIHIWNHTLPISTWLK